MNQEANQEAEQKTGAGRRTAFALVSAGVVFCTLLMVGMWAYAARVQRQIDAREAGAQQAYDRHYVLIANDTASGLWGEVYESARAEAMASGAYLEWLDTDALAEYSAGDYLRIAIASKVDGILMQPDGSQSVRTLIQRAAEQGIPVVTALEDDPKSARVSFVGINSYQMGKLYGEEIVRQLSGEDADVLVLANAHTRDTGTNLVISQIAQVVRDSGKDGARREIRSYDIDLSETFDSEEAIRDIFVSKEKLPDVLVCLDEQITECACQAIVDYNQVGNVKVIGYHTSEAIEDAIARGILASTVAFRTEEIGRYSVDALNEYHALGHVNNYFNIGLQVEER